MRKGLQKVVNENNNYRIIAVDDEEGIVDSLDTILLVLQTQWKQ